MAGSGSDTRQRTISLTVRLTPEEASLVRTLADQSGVSLAGIIRYALLNQSPPRATRKSALPTQDAARILATLGQIATALRDLAKAGGGKAGSSEADASLLDAMYRDLADMRVVLFEALGKEP